jgi:hypothetical protein
VRFSVYLVTVALATSLVPAGCGGGSQAAVDSARLAAPASHRANRIHYIVFKDGTIPENDCPHDRFAFCITISPETTGPYWGWCGNVSCYGSQYEMVATSEILELKTGKPANNKLPQSFSPSPGNPTWLYITEAKPIRAAKSPKFMLISSACEYFNPSTCYGPIKVGLVPGP